MKINLRNAFGVVVFASVLAGCAKEPVVHPPLPLGGSANIESKRESLGTFVFKHYNSNHYQGPFTVSVEYDQLPFSSHFNLCDSDEEKCKSSLILRKETGSNRVVATFDLTMIDTYDNQGAPITATYKINGLPIKPGAMKLFNSFSDQGIKNEVGIFLPK